MNEWCSGKLWLAAGQEGSHDRSNYKYWRRIRRLVMRESKLTIGSGSGEFGLWRSELQSVTQKRADERLSWWHSMYAKILAVVPLANIIRYVYTIEAVSVLSLASRYPLSVYAKELLLDSMVTDYKTTTEIDWKYFYLLENRLALINSHLLPLGSPGRRHPLPIYMEQYQHEAN